MATAYSSNLALALPVTGELSGTWGTTVNTQITNMLDEALGYQTFSATGSTDTLTIPDGTTGVARSIYIQLNGTGGGTVTVPTTKTKMYFVFNNTSSAITFKVTGQTGVSIPAAAKMALVSNGTDIIVAQNYFSTLTLGAALPVASGGTGLSSGTSGGVLAYTATGTLASSAALAASALVIGGGAGAAPSTTTTGTGVVTALGVNVGTAGAFVVNGGALGTPSSGTVTNLTGTASININGTVGATTPATGAFTTLSATGATTLSAQLTASTGDGTYPIISKDTRAFSVGVTGPQLGFFGLDSTSTNNSLGAFRALAQSSQNGTLEARVLLSGSITTIGTFSSTGLEVTGTLSNVGLFTNFTGAAKTVNAASNVRLFQTNEAVNYAALQGSFVGAATAADRVFRFQTVEQGVANDGIISFQPDGGKFGIGTASPLDVLEVVSANATYRNRIRNSGANEATLLFQNSSTGTATNDGLYVGIVSSMDAYLWNYENNPIIFGTYNTERMRLDSGGNLLVGTTSAYLSTFSGITAEGKTSGVGNNLSLGLYKTGTPQILNGDVLGNIYFYGADNDVTAGNNNIGARIASIATTDWTTDGTTSNAALVFYTHGTTSGAPPERARFNSTGALVFAGGTTTADGIGITFPATQSASSNANTLDDYEEGTWTPVVIGTISSGTGTYSTQIGSYTKVGRLVTVVCGLAWSAHTGTGNIQITGLPFVNSADISVGSVFASNMNFGTLATQLAAFVLGSDNIISFRGMINNALRADTTLDSSVESLYITLSYERT